MSRAVSPTSSAASFAARPEKPITPEAPEAFVAGLLRPADVKLNQCCEGCGNPVGPRRASLGYRVCLECAESAPAPRYRADCATTREGQVLELALHLSGHQYRSWQQYQRRATNT